MKKGHFKIQQNLYSVTFVQITSIKLQLNFTKQSNVLHALFLTQCFVFVFFFDKETQFLESLHVNMEPGGKKSTELLRNFSKRKFYQKGAISLKDMRFFVSVGGQHTHIKNVFKKYDDKRLTRENKEKKQGFESKRKRKSIYSNGMF